MGLSCKCDLEPAPGSWISYQPDDFEPLRTKMRKRCESCNELIDIGALVLKFRVVKIPEYEVEIDIYGEDGEVPRAPRYLCEKCGEIFFNLDELGFCIWVSQDMRDLLREYQETYNPPKLNE